MSAPSKVLVTGGAGYVGSTLVPLLLAEGRRVRVLDSLMHGGGPLLSVWNHPGFDFVRGDMRDEGAVRGALEGVEAVVHLAAIVGDPACARQPDLARSVNLEASLRLLEEAERAGVRRFVFASTCSNYGKMTDSSRLADEDAELRPVSLYAETKVAVEKEMLSGGTGEMCRTPLRFATVFGVSGRMRFDLTVNEFTLKLMTERRLLVYGEQFWRPYVHVRDAARAIARVIEADRGAVDRTVFNVGATEQNYTKKQLVEIILPYAPDADVQYVHKEEDPRDYRVSFARIQRVLGFQVSRSVQDGVQEIARLVDSGVIREFDAIAYKN